MTGQAKPGQAKEPANQKISAAECLQQEQQMEANNIRKKHKCDVFIFKKESKKKLKKRKGIVRYFCSGHSHNSLVCCIMSEGMPRYLLHCSCSWFC